jgi:hypothetical protein
MNSLEDLLREKRPTLTPMELDQVKQRARAQANRTTDIYGWKGIRIMRPRLVATSLLVAGMFFTGSGATLAVISDTQSAGIAQYPGSTTPTETTSTPAQTTAPEQNGQEVLGEKFSGGTPQQTTAPDTSGQKVLDERASGNSPATPPASVQANRQLGTSGGGKELPFTGFAAIPILLIGILMLSTGIALRRSMRSNEA